MCYRYGEDSRKEKRESFLSMQKWAEKFYKGTAWQRTRAVAWARDKGLCQDCLRKGIIKPAQEVHHIKELTPENIDNAAVSLNLDNLVSLCKDCHAQRHVKNVRRYEILPNGNVISR